MPCSTQQRGIFHAKALAAGPEGPEWGRVRFRRPETGVSTARVRGFGSVSTARVRERSGKLKKSVRET